MRTAVNSGYINISLMLLIHIILRNRWLTLMILYRRLQWVGKHHLRIHLHLKLPYAVPLWQLVYIRSLCHRDKLMQLLGLLVCCVRIIQLICTNLIRELLVKISINLLNLIELTWNSKTHIRFHLSLGDVEAFYLLDRFETFLSSNNCSSW